MLGPVFTMLLLTLVLEIYLFIEVGGAIGAGWTLLFVFATAFWGMSRMRSQGMSVLAEAQAAQKQGRPPLAAVGHGVLIILGGLLLVLPGFFTDSLGLLLMLRWTRLLVLESVLAMLMPHLMRGFQARQAGQMKPGPHAAANSEVDGPGVDGPDIIEGDFRVEDEDRKAPNK